jgi:hypothetical protein
MDRLCVQRVLCAGVLAVQEDRELLPDCLAFGPHGSFKQLLLSILSKLAPALSDGLAESARHGVARLRR